MIEETGRHSENETEIEVTPEMIEIGKEIIVVETGGGPFSAPELALKVFLAMERCGRATRFRPSH